MVLNITAVHNIIHMLLHICAWKSTYLKKLPRILDQRASSLVDKHASSVSLLNGTISHSHRNAQNILMKMESFQSSLSFPDVQWSSGSGCWCPCPSLVFPLPQSIWAPFHFVSLWLLKVLAIQNSLTQTEDFKMKERDCISKLINSLREDSKMFAHVYLVMILETSC